MKLGAVICFVANQVFRCFASAGEALGRRAVVCFASGQQDGEFAAFDLWRPTASEGAGNFVASMAKRQDISVAEVEKQFFEKIRPTSLLKRFESTEEVASAVAARRLSAR